MESSANTQLFILTPAAGKRLIARALLQHPAIRTALEARTIVVVAGTTNGYVAEELLAAQAPGAAFDRQRFFRGVTLPPARVASGVRPPNEAEFPGDVVLVKGAWQPGKTIFDVVDGLQEGDVVLKGANALDLVHRRAAVLVGHPKAGTIGAIQQAVVGRRVRLILPVGLEKRVPGSLDELAAKVNAPGARGPRLYPAPGEAFTELDAIRLLTGATAELVAAGGVGGAEGSVWLAIGGPAAQMEKASALLSALSAEPNF